jgi:hypothetical protein
VFVFANVLEKKGFAPEARVSSNHPEGFCSRGEGYLNVDCSIRKVVLIGLLLKNICFVNRALY